MYDVKIVTYLRANEYVNENIKLIISTLYTKYPQLSIIFFVDKDRTDIEIQLDIPYKIINFPGTKYLRIKKILDTEKNSILVSIDNDTTILPDNFLSFMNDFIRLEYDIGFARIKALEKKSFISKMISVDKLLSHTVIRPLLWKMKVGISIPGQLFVIKSKSFYNKLLNIDTFLDDLAIGIYVNIHIRELKLLISKKVIGMEIPKNSFKDLCIQRKRWAKGYYTIWKNIKGKEEQKLIKWHCFAYHLSWILNFTIIIVLSTISLYISLIYICLISLLISLEDIKYYFASLVYQIFFPIFHIIWIIYFFKDKKNDDNA